MSTPGGRVNQQKEALFNVREEINPRNTGS